MGLRTDSVQEVVRGGKSRLVIDFHWLDREGRERRYRRSATVQTWTAARAEAQRLKLRAQAEGTLARRPPAPTFAAFVESEAWATHLATRCRPATRERYAALLRQGILDTFGRKRLSDISAQDYRRYEATLAARKVQGRGPLGLVRTVLRVAVEAGALDRMPELPSLPRPSRKLPDAPDDAEVAAMLTHATGWLRVAIALAVYAGLRSGEVRALEVRDVDLRRGRLLVRRAFSADDVLTPKSGHERVVPLAPELQAILAPALRSKLPAARVVLNSAGETPDRQAVLTATKGLQARHGLPERSFHALRHAFCSLLVRRGASVEAVRVLAGHGSVTVTARYLHANAADLESAIGKLGGLGT
ncbi:MAG TPA: tyrosine-type recombinase/integrase [Solirubrobacteraceae bacterium]|nr:tyrosine-type recombinase/integrase [Solirubrobacteraceae bacterium]